MQLSAPATAPLDLLAAPAGVSDALLALVAPAPAAPGVVPAANGSVDFAALLPDATPAPSLETNATPATAATVVSLADSMGAQPPASAIAATPVTTTTPVVVAKTARLARVASNPFLCAQSRSADACSETPLTSAPRSARHTASPLARETDEPETLLPESNPVAFAQPSSVESVIVATLPVATNLTPPDAPVPDASVELNNDDRAPNVARPSLGRLVSTTLPSASANASPLTERVSLDQPWRGAFPSAQRRLETAAPSSAATATGTEASVPAKIAGPQVPVSVPSESQRDDAPVASRTVSTEVGTPLAPELAKNSAPVTTDLDPLAQPQARVGAVALNSPSDFASALGRLPPTAPAEVSPDVRSVALQPSADLSASASDTQRTDTLASAGAITPTAPTTSLDAPVVLAATDASNVSATTPKPSLRREEKIAAAFAKNFGERISSRASSQKTFLDTDPEDVTTAVQELGIDVAKSAPTMPAFTFAHHSAPDAAFARVAPAHAMVASVEQAVQSEPLVATDAPAAAHRAVEAALAAAERFSTNDRQAVSLQFSVGGADLAVRVELRADEVRATFRTDSPELRSALAHEWSAVVADAGERSFRLAPPVITSNSGDTSGLAAFAGDSAPRQRDSQNRRANGDVFASVASRARGAVSSVAVEVVASAARSGLLPTSLHLHTLA